MTLEERKYKRQLAEMRERIKANAESKASQRVAELQDVRRQDRLEFEAVAKRAKDAEHALERKINHERIAGAIGVAAGVAIGVALPI